MKTRKHWKPKNKVKTNKEEGHIDAEEGENQCCWRTNGPGKGENGMWGINHALLHAHMQGSKGATSALMTEQWPPRMDKFDPRRENRSISEGKMEAYDGKIRKI